MSPPDFINLSILRAACALVHPKNRTAGQSNNPPPENFLKPVCGISVVKRKITPVFTEVISLLVDLKGIEPSNLTDANRALSQLSYGPKCNAYYTPSPPVCKALFHIFPP